MTDNSIFTDVPARAIAYIVAMDIDPIIVTGKQVATIRDVLDLDIRTSEDLQKVRNTIVRDLADAASIAREDGDYATFDRLHTAMSATTAVIDDTLWKRGALY